MPNPLYWFSRSNRTGYIVFTPHIKDAKKESKWLFMYDIQTRKYHKTKSYGDNIRPRCCGNVINHETDELYIFGG